MTRKEIARELFMNGYTCSQSIVVAFKDLVNVDEETLLKMSLPLGGGLGRLRLTCGTFSSIALIVGLLFSKNEISEENKLNTYQIIQELAKRFQEKLGTLSCKELLEKAKLEVEIGGKPEFRTEEYYKKRPCGKIVYFAAEIFEDYLKEKGII